MKTIQIERLDKNSIEGTQVDTIELNKIANTVEVPLNYLGNIMDESERSNNVYMCFENSQTNHYYFLQID